MKKYSITLFLLITFNTLQAQPNIDKKRDFVWLTGYESYTHNIGVFAGTTITDFSTCEMQQHYQYTNIDFSFTSASICDTSGKLMFYTNGNTIEDSTGQTMLNGDSLSIPDYLYPRGNNTIKGSLILPMGNGYNYVLLHPAKLEFDTRFVPAKQFSSALLITKIDMRGNNGKGSVVSKRIPILRDTSWSIFARACRHANGRDWWVLRLNKNLNKCYRLLISPYGIDSLPPISLPFVADTAAFNAGTNTCFSSNGRLFIHHNGKKLWLYDFDRCTGTLSNRRVFARPGFSGIEFSPSSRYLYMNRDTIVIQYDTQATDIDASAIIVGRWDGSYSYLTPGTSLNTQFFQPMLAPNGKIYINAAGTGIIWHTIHNPDSAGLACDLRLHDVRLPTWYYGTTPNLPNFRLGAERGTVCDSLGIEESAPYICVQNTATSSPEKQEVKVRIYPNPANGILYIEAPDIAKKAYLYNALGQEIKQLFITNPSTQLNTYDIPNGIYFLSVLGADGRLVGRQRLVVQH